MRRRAWFLLRALTLDYRERRLVRRALAMNTPDPPELPSGRHWTELDPDALHPPTLTEHTRMTTTQHPIPGHEWPCEHAEGGAGACADSHCPGYLTPDDFFVWEDEPPRMPWRERLARAWAALCGHEYETPLDAVRRDVLAWQGETFPHRTVKSITAHLAKEGAELLDAPNDRYEHADVRFLAWAALDEADRLASAYGVSVLSACRDKLAVNRARTWGAPDADGVVLHVTPRDAAEDFDAAHEREANRLFAAHEARAGRGRDAVDPCPKGDPDCETGDDGSCHDACVPPVSPEETRDLLLLVCDVTPWSARELLEVCAAWSQDERERAAAWAGAVHLAASDHDDVDIPDMPAHVRALVDPDLPASEPCTDDAPRARCCPTCGSPLTERGNCARTLGVLRSLVG